jgi:hypothetical protein
VNVELLPKANLTKRCETYNPSQNQHMTLLPTGNMNMRLQEDCTDYTGSRKSHISQCNWQEAEVQLTKHILKKSLVKQMIHSKYQI